MRNTFLTISLILVTTLINGQNLEKFNHIIKNEKLGDLTFNIYADKNYQGLILVSTNLNSMPTAFNVTINPNEQKELSDFIYFDDFDFDGINELVINDYNQGIYLYDNKTLEEKNILTGQFANDNNPIPKNSNYIHLARGTYEINKNEKEITIQGSCGAMCGIKEVYGLNSEGNFVLKRKEEWGY